MSGRRSLATAQTDIPRWKVGAASAAVGAVAFGVVGGALWRGLQPEPAAHAVSQVAPRAVSQVAPPAPSSPASEREAVIATVRAALDAWGAFARSADLGDVEEAFAVGGPQHRQFRREARSGLAGAEQVPTLSLRSVAAVDAVGRRREVVTRVAVSADGGPSDVRDWVFVLEQAAGSWRVWTVIDQAD